MKKSVLLGSAFTVLTLMASSVLSVEAANPNWNAAGNYVINMEYLGTQYAHDLHLTQNNAGNLTGNGGSPVGANVYAWVLTSGSVSGNTIDFLANYTALADAVVPLTTLHIVGTIGSDGKISGTWSDNYLGGSRSGALTTTSGAAIALRNLTVTLAGTGLGTATSSPAGISCGLDCAESYNHNISVTLTANPVAGSTFFGWSGACTGTSSCVLTMNEAKTVTANFTLDSVTTIHTISASSGANGSISPSGAVAVNHGSDKTFTVTSNSGYSVKNVSVDGVSQGVVNTYTFTNVTANHTIAATFKQTKENNSTPQNKKECKKGGWKDFTDPTFKSQSKCINFVKKQQQNSETSDSPVHKKECKKGGWKNFTNPSFRNQGRCVSFVEKKKYRYYENRDEDKGWYKFFKNYNKRNKNANDDSDDDDDNDD